MRTLRILASLFLVACAAVAVAGSSDVVLDALLQRPRTASGVVVVPDRSCAPGIRSPCFFPSSRGRPGAEIRPERFAGLEPDWPGAWTWLDDKTLQFRPAEPYPPLEVLTVDVRGQGRPVVLATLMDPPLSSEPRHGAVDLPEVERISLSFPRAMDPDALARLISIEVRPLPGIGDGPSRRLTGRDFEVKVLDQTTAEDPARYALVLHHPIALGQRATVRFGLSLDDTDEAVSRLSFTTAAPFRGRDLGCPGQSMPMGPDGVVFPADKPLRCSQQQIRVGFTAPPDAIGPIEGRNLVRFEPAVPDLSYRLSGRTLHVSGTFRPEVPYRVSIAPSSPPLRDRSGRPLELRGEGVVWVYFPRQAPFLRWGRGHGIAERYGPQRNPDRGPGPRQGRRPDPPDRSAEPQPVAVPPGPAGARRGRASPGPGRGARSVGQRRSDLLERARPAPRRPRLPRDLRIVDLPLDPEAAATRVGLDVAPMLAQLSRSGAPGHYLVGLRRLDAGTERSWVRLQVTDLSLSTIENPSDAVFAVSSLSTGSRCPERWSGSRAGALVGLERVAGAVRGQDRRRRAGDLGRAGREARRHDPDRPGGGAARRRRPGDRARGRRVVPRRALAPGIGGLARLDVPRARRSR